MPCPVYHKNIPMKEKGVSPVSLLRYKLSNIFIGRSIYMQQQTGIKSF